ncbi:MAG: hypothetical protein DRP57_04600 [Spirochaetes bacterium]|nr:MAG: hypothetical protein DRP57_04600 [Spirochaetota bacterium]
MYFLIIQLFKNEYKDDIFLAFTSSGIKKASFFEGYNLDLVSYFNDNLLQIIAWQLAFVIILSIISSSIAIGRYLRV